MLEVPSQLFMEVLIVSSPTLGSLIKIGCEDRIHERSIWSAIGGQALQLLGVHRKE